METHFTPPLYIAYFHTQEGRAVQHGLARCCGSYQIHCECGAFWRSNRYVKTDAICIIFVDLFYSFLFNKMLENSSCVFTKLWKFEKRRKAVETQATSKKEIDVTTLPSTKRYVILESFSVFGFTAAKLWLIQI